MFVLHTCKVGTVVVSSLDALGRSPQNLVTLSEQIRQFSTVRETLKGMLGREAADKFLGKSLFFISIGSNDDIFGYSQLECKVSKAEFIYTLVSAYETHLNVNPPLFSELWHPGKIPFHDPFHWIQT